jgi:hypothetical protein
LLHAIPDGAVIFRIVRLFHDILPET